MDFTILGCFWPFALVLLYSLTQPDFRTTAGPRFLSLLNVERKQALDRQKKREDLLEDTEHGSKILGLHQDLQVPGPGIGASS